MQKFNLWAVTFGLLLIAGSAAIVSAQTAKKPALKFDNALRQEFEKGMAGDADALERALAGAKKILANDPKDANALVWMGSAMLASSGAAFKAGNYGEGGELWKGGLEAMDAAVASAPEQPEIIIVRGSTLMQASKKFPVAAEAARLRLIGIGDVEKFIKLTGDNFRQMPEPMRARLLLNLAEAYELNADKTQARIYFERLKNETAAGAPREKAVKWLAENKN